MSNISNPNTNDSTAHKLHRFSFGKRKILLMLIDIICFAASYAILSLFSGSIGQHFDTTHIGHVIVAGVTLLIVLCVRFALRVYRTIWRYPNVRSYLAVVISDVLGGIVSGLVVVLLLPTSIKGNIGLSEIIFVVAAFDLVTLTNRFCYQLYRLRRSSNKKPYDFHHAHMNKIGVAIVGAGQIGIRLADELVCYVNLSVRVDKY